MELKIKGLSKTYPNGVRALKNINLNIGTGMFGLLGPNGAGKSSLMRTIATLQEADSGEIELDGLDILKEKQELRKILGYLPQEFGLYPKISAEELLDHLAVLKGISSRKERKDIVESLLQQTNLYHVRNLKLGSYSGGMKQRFGIAQALLGNPRLIIVDEPTAGLDPAERNRFHNLLSEIGENVIVILSTHIVEDVSELCRQMAIINKGEVLLTGEPSRLIDNLEGRIWKKIIRKEELAQYQGEYPVISSHVHLGNLLIKINSDLQPGPGFETVRPNLEDVYFSGINLTRTAETVAQV